MPCTHVFMSVCAVPCCLGHRQVEVGEAEDRDRQKVPSGAGLGRDAQGPLPGCLLVPGPLMSETLGQV